MVHNRLMEPLGWRRGWAYRIRGGMYGLAVGDALGVPWEFSEKHMVRREWNGGMVGGGTWGQPAGTWSDDTGQALALADALASKGLDLEAIGRALLSWFLSGRYTANGSTPFDVGATTRAALENLLRGIPPEESGVESASCGSLMRAYPLAVYTACMPLEEALKAAHMVSRVTHRHPEAEMACGLYTVIIRGLLAGYNLPEAVKAAGEVLESYYATRQPFSGYTRAFSYLVDGESLLWEPGTGSCWAPETLRDAVWAVVTTRSFRDAVVEAVRLGGDTDTVAAVAGSIAGTLYGYKAIPREWLNILRGRELLEKVTGKLVARVEMLCTSQTVDSEA